MSVIVLIPAAGMGRRMGAAVNKQYLHLAGRPILAHTLACFDHHPLVDAIYVISPSDEIEFCREEVVRRYGFAKVREIVAGGAQRQDSVRHGLLACDANPDDIILIHDGVRPFFPGHRLADLVESAKRTGACLAGVPVKDTIKEVRKGMVSGTPDRSFLWQAQTPQAFRFEIIVKAHEQALSDGFLGTDDTSLVERLGLPVAMVEGDYRNIKITTPEDLLAAEAIWQAGQEDSPC
ncbi:2-C-methyl-D-erythritol 4-phosphate cytidylyltransferase [Desulfuromonas sp. AOP6]|uniref:2-C-methyl-D-erythritol 4-phosphate cytidylyltransferase n=1 Tax=Desulfuromonas sp. AOP6 TaxID=1566351 RepID=UPI0012741F1C|nr:2-C-methyl-D-erythritol 4-phosphate cytidylyltransferase [Desulfuromonas sp. AOP6]BCA78307.1 2-C-methyl-D-erythritol 4-phosphatecytidylyltransferase [Desulfuromonas sp. AOP6]